MMSTEEKRIEEFKKSDYASLLRGAFDGLKRGILYESHIHGQGHIERTMLLAAMIAEGEKLTEDEMKLCLLACSYHDIGRANDYLDRYHGTISANRISAGIIDDVIADLSEDDTNILKAAICSHSDHDSNLSFYERIYDVKDHERYMKVAMTLKDADNLDRVRLGDLDEKYLRQKTSRELPGVAQWIFDNMKNVSKEI